VCHYYAHACWSLLDSVGGNVEAHNTDPGDEKKHKLPQDNMQLTTDGVVDAGGRHPIGLFPWTLAMTLVSISATGM
jgi:hypothetical protein